MALVMYENDKRNEEERLHGIVPQHYFAYRVFKFFRFIGIAAIIFAVIILALKFIPNDIIQEFTSVSWYIYIIMFFAAIALVCGFFCLVIYVIWLRKPPFDVWVFEFAEKRLGTDVIYYNSRCLYIQYDRASTKEVDKKDFVTEMSDHSEHYSYYYIDTYIDLGVIQVECERRAPIPDRASFKPSDDPLWNVIPVGLTVNMAEKKISPIGWYLNDQNKNNDIVETAPSVSFLIAGGTGCHSINELILIHNKEHIKTYKITKDDKEIILNEDFVLKLINKQSKDSLYISIKDYLLKDDTFKENFDLELNF